jgi:soluble lytic murein transglycosylase-like protein
MSFVSGVAPGGLGDVLDRISSLGGRAAIGPSFEEILDAAGANRTGPVIVANGTADMTKSKLATTGATASAWPSVQSALAATTLGGYAGAASTLGGPSASAALGALGLTGTQSPTDHSWTAALPDGAAPWVGAITDAAQRNDVDPRLLAALVWTESGFRTDAVSGAGARGLTQLMPGTAAGMGVDPDDPLQNLDGGARYLRAALDRFGSPDLALAAYNAGPGNVAKYGGVPPFDETQRYVSTVLDRYRQLGGQS